MTDGTGRAAATRAADPAPRRAAASGSPHRALMELALAMVLFGSATPVARIVTAAMPVFVAGSLRAVIGSLLLLPVILRRRRALAAIDRRSWGLIALISAVGMVGFTVFMLYGMQMVSGIEGSVVMSATPAVTALASVLVLKDRVSWRTVAAVGLAVAGVLVLQLGAGGVAGEGAAGGEQGGGPSWTGMLLVFAAVCCQVAYTLLGKLVAQRVDPVLVAALSAWMSLIVFLPLALWQLPDFAPHKVGGEAWAAALWYGAGTLAMGNWLWYAGLARVQGAVAAGFMALMPVSALVLSYILLGEPFRMVHLAGFVVVLASVLMISWEHARMARRAVARAACADRAGDEESEVVRG